MILLDYKAKYNNERKKNRELKNIIRNKDETIKNYDVLLTLTKDNLKLARSIIKSQDDLPR